MQMNTHPISNEELMAYLDGEAPAGAGEQTAAHLEHCEDCQDAAADFESVARRLRAWSVATAKVEMPSDIVAELDGAAIPETRKDRFSWFRIHPMLTALCGGAALILTAVIASVPHRFPEVRVLGDSKIETHPERQATSDFVTDTTFPSRQGGSTSPSAGAPVALLIVRNAQLRLTVPNLVSARSSLDQILSRFQGHIAQLDLITPTGAPHFLNATLRLPAAQLDAALAALRRLGHVDDESQRGEEVTQRHVDIEARLANARNTEQRLTEILRTRTGKLSDVLEVEEQLDKVRAQIETGEAEQKVLANQLALATVQLNIGEEHRQSLAAERSSLFTRIRNAGVDGLRVAGEGVMEIVLWLLKAGPSLLLVAAVIALPLRFLWRRRQR